MRYILTFPSCDRSIESDLISLCMTPLECRNARAFRHARQTVATWVSFILPLNILQINRGRENFSWLVSPNIFSVQHYSILCVLVTSIFYAHEFPDKTQHIKSA